MVDDEPTSRELRPGMTVRIVQDEEPEEKEPIVGTVRQVLDETHTQPGGVTVKLESGAVGNVKEVVSDTEGI